MPAKTNLLFTGATGYIGGTVLAKLLEHPAIASYNITAIVRSPEKAEKLAKLGVNVVVGSHSDEPLVEKLASESDIVIATADADNVEAMRATLRGLKKRYESTKNPPIFIHTSGTGVISDDARGQHSNHTVYDDANPDQIETIPDTAVHRNVDLEIVKADKEGYVKTYIVLPSTIYGIASNKLVDLGIQNPHSVQIPGLIKIALERKQTGVVGEGKNVWPNVHIDEVAELYIVLFNAIRSNPDSIGHGREGFYFGENGEYGLAEAGKRISNILFKKGLVKDAEVTPFTKEEIDKWFYGSYYAGSNSRCKANRSRSIGWKPTKTTDDFWASLEPEIDALAKSQK